MRKNAKLVAVSPLHVFIVQGCYANTIAAGTDYGELWKQCAAGLPGETHIAVSRCLNNNVFARNCSSLYVGRVADMPKEPPQPGEL